MLLNIPRSLFAITCCLFIFVPVAAADSHEWKDPAYNFEKVKSIFDNTFNKLPLIKKE